MTDDKPLTTQKIAQHKPTKRGGARPGAGRKRGSGDGLVSKIQVCVTPQQKFRFEKLGAAKWLRTFLSEDSITSRFTRESPLQDGEYSETTATPTNTEVENEQVTPVGRAGDVRKISQLINFNEYLVGSSTKNIVVAAESDDMRLAGVVKGDLLIVDPMTTPENGDLVLIHRKDAYVARRFKCSKSRCAELHTERSNGKDRVIELRKNSNFSMIGVIVGVVRKTR